MNRNTIIGIVVVVVIIILAWFLFTGDDTADVTVEPEPPAVGTEAPAVEPVPEPAD